MREKAVSRGMSLFDCLFPNKWFVILNSSDHATKVAGLCGVNSFCNRFLGTVINLFVDCESSFLPLSLGTSPFLLGSSYFLADGCEPRGTPARRDFPSRDWSMFVETHRR